MFRNEGGDLATERWLINFANKFDHSAAMLADTLMCSRICPCHSVRTVDESGKRTDPAWTWEQMPESELNHYGRTRETEHVTELVPLVFKATREGTYENFEDCFINLKLNATPALKVLDQDA